MARKSLDWSTRLYSEAFTGRARSITHCTICLQDDHPTQRNPQNSDRSWWGWLLQGLATPVGLGRCAGGTMMIVCTGCLRAGLCTLILSLLATMPPFTVAVSGNMIALHHHHEQRHLGQVLGGHAANSIEPCLTLLQPMSSYQTFNFI